ncbi:uncharacterized protein LOC109842871 [Asparagus officinalis]|uniref:uncharacterized protein LOC109842871 n=1 Tax=Asparagus officinalis TaxID=4686 RepID=UPI00098DF27E|nr:uncharacterized protein LOC109842871 [Asparagus officinalis]
MILYLLPPSVITTSSISTSHYTNGNKLKPLFLPSSFLPISSIKLTHLRPVSNGRRFALSPCCSLLLEAPVLWAGRLCVFYALLKAGLAGSPSNPIFSSELGGDVDDLGFSKWFESFQGLQKEFILLASAGIKFRSTES